MPHTPSPYLVTNAPGAGQGGGSAQAWPALEARASLAMYRVTEDATHLHAALSIAHRLGRLAFMSGPDEEGGRGLAGPAVLIASEPLLRAHWQEGAIMAMVDQLARAGGGSAVQDRRRAAAEIAKLVPAPRTTGSIEGDVALADWWPKARFERGPSNPLSDRWIERADDDWWLDGSDIDDVAGDEEGYPL